jgi:hypothetical protein
VKVRDLRAGIFDVNLIGDQIFSYESTGLSTHSSLGGGNFVTGLSELSSV